MSQLDSTPIRSSKREPYSLAVLSLQYCPHHPSSLYNVPVRTTLEDTFVLHASLDSHRSALVPVSLPPAPKIYMLQDLISITTEKRLNQLPHFSHIAISATEYTARYFRITHFWIRTLGLTGDFSQAEHINSAPSGLLYFKTRCFHGHVQALRKVASSSATRCSLVTYCMDKQIMRGRFWTIIAVV